MHMQSMKPSKRKTKGYKNNIPWQLLHETNMQNCPLNGISHVNDPMVPDLVCAPHQIPLGHEEPKEKVFSNLVQYIGEKVVAICFSIFFFKGKGYKRYTECSHWNGIEPTNKNPSLFRLKLKVATGVLTRWWGVGWAEIKPNWMYFGPRWFSSEKTFKVLSKNDRLKRKVNISHGITLFPYLWVTRVIVSTLENHCAISQI